MKDSQSAILAEHLDRIFGEGESFGSSVITLIGIRFRVYGANCLRCSQHRWSTSAASLQRACR